MRRWILFLTCFFLLNPGEAVGQSVGINIPPTRKNVYDCDAYIKKYAPSDSALKVLNNLASILAMSGHPSKSRLVYSIYKPLFQSRGGFFERQMEYYKQTMLCGNPEGEAERDFDIFINEEAPSEAAFVAVQRIAGAFIRRRSWVSAASVFKRYKPLFKNMTVRFDNIVKTLLAPEEGLTVSNIGPAINTPRAEWDPTPTPDGKRLYFSTRGRRGGFGASDVWASEMKDGKWSPAVNLGKAINGRNDETIDNVSADGVGLFFSGTFEGTLGKFDIFYSRKTKKGWDKLYHFPEPINSVHTDEGGSITSDGKALIFSSDRPDGIGDFHPHSVPFHGSAMGNMDIYVCMKTADGWGLPINLGPRVNTPYSERSPYLHPDGKTLYFSSDGHAGLGRLDVFKSIRLKEDSWTQWSEPVNLGKEINGAGEDWGYNVSVSGDSAFFSILSKKGGYGNWDIYTVTLPGAARPEPVTLVRGWVTDENGNPLAVDIKWEDLETGKNAGELKSDPQDGSYVIALPLGKNYGYFAELDGYYPTSKNVDLRQLVAEPDINENIVLVSVKDMKEKGKKIRINNLFFDFDKSELKSESFHELNRLARFLKKNQDMKVEIDGHTDYVGSPEYNKSLSIERAEAVRSYLVKKGISSGSFIVKGFGAERPASDSTTDFGRSQNRRVEVWFVN